MQRPVSFAAPLAALAGLAASVSTGCTAHCPPGTVARGGMPPAHGARWCESDASPGPQEPTVTVTHANQLQVDMPGAIAGRAIEGPITTWHPNDTLASHGAYAVKDGVALAHGVWTFWEGGRRRSQGRFHYGDPVGCFGIFSEDGERTTGIATGGDIQPAECEPPRHEAADVLEAELTGRGGPRGDLALQLLLTPGATLVKSPSYTPSEAAMNHGVAAAARVHLGATRLGGSVSLRRSAEDYLGITPTAVVGHSLTDPMASLGLEASAELGAQLTWAKPKLNNGLPSHGRVFLWTPLVAGQVEAVWRVSHVFALTAAGRAELRMPREVNPEVLFCGFTCPGTRSETWQLGGAVFAAVLGLRLLLW